MKRFFSILVVLACINAVAAQQLFEISPLSQSRLSSFENINGVKGKGGITNKSAKGNAFEMLQPGETKTLMDINGEGMITRTWLTVNQSPAMLKSLRLRMFWDNEKKAAVDVPLGDFFLQSLGKSIAYETALFSSGEGRSFNCYIPMPFRKHARIILSNEGNEPCKLFFDISYLLQKNPLHASYFHAYWMRQQGGKPGDDVNVLPLVKGAGRFLGMSVALLTDSAYDRTWWGEGEVKMFMDGDRDHPTWVGTGAEDYIGSAWGLGKFINLYQGCTFASEGTREFSFYRFHIPDPIYFQKDIHVTWQQVGGGDYKLVKELVKNGSKLVPVTVDGKSFTRLLDMHPVPAISDTAFPEGWVNFYRTDDYSVTSYFYFEKAATNLPSLPAVASRLIK